MSELEYELVQRMSQCEEGLVIHKSASKGLLTSGTRLSLPLGEQKFQALASGGKRFKEHCVEGSRLVEAFPSEQATECHSLARKRNVTG